MRLTAVLAGLHVFNGEVNWAKPIELALACCDGSFIRLRVAGDGETMTFDRLALEGPVDMGERGRTEVRDFTDHLDPTLRGSQVDWPCLIHDGTGRSIGLAIPRKHGEPFCIWADGNELHWGDWGALVANDWPWWVSPTLGKALSHGPADGG